MNLHRLRAGSAVVALSFGSLLFAQSTDKPSPPGSQYPDTQTNATPSTSEDQKSDTQHLGNTTATPSDTTDSAATNADSTATATRASTSDGTITLQVASPGTPTTAGANLLGQTVRSNDGQKVGEVKSFLVDEKTREPRFAVVSGAGAFGFGTTLRLVPFEAFQSTSSQGDASNTQIGSATASSGITVAMNRSQWDLLPRVTDQELQQGTVTLNSQQQQQVAQVFGATFSDQTSGVASTTPAEPSTAATPSGGPPPFFRAPSFAANSSTATASTNASSPSNSTAGTTTVGTSTAGAVATNSTPFSSSISPTGQTSAEQNPVASAALISASRAVREALDRDPALARLNVRVEPQNGRIVLHGTVPSPNDKSAVQAAAEQAAQGFQVDADLGVGQEEP